MLLLVVNPNTSPEMTTAILETARSVAEDTVIDAVQPDHGPASVEGRFDEVVSAYWTLARVLPIAEDYDGILIACYSAHPVIGALREALRKPVLGIMEASVLQALPLGDQFSIVTTSARWRPLLLEGVRLLGVERRCASVRSTGMTVLDLEAIAECDVVERIRVEAKAAVEEDGAEVVCLGCAGMTNLREAVQRTISVPVLDGVQAGITMLRGLVVSGVSTSKWNTYRAPDRRLADGLPEGIAQVYGSS